MDARSAALTILGRLARPVNFSFAYGSGVKTQKGSDRRSQMLDLCVVISNPVEWHTHNLRDNINHYSSLGRLGPTFVAAYQEHFGAKVYCNTMVPFPEYGIYYKYGVIRLESLISDLLNWDYLYLAGRLHKPVEFLIPPVNSKLTDALNANLISAVRAALLLLPENFSEYEFYHTVANISYAGDFRMIFGENKRKVDNIISPQLSQFGKLYSGALITLNNFVINNNGKFHQDKGSLAQLQHLCALPTTVRQTIGDLSSDETLKQLIQIGPADAVRHGLQSIVRNSSISQTLKNFLSAGIMKSISYSLRKIRKMF